MNDSMPDGPVGNGRMTIPRRELDAGLLAPSPSPRPSPLGRGRIIRRFSINRSRRFTESLATTHEACDCCSLSPWERVRVRGNSALLIGRCALIPGTVQLRRTSGGGGAFSARPWHEKFYFR